MDHAAQRHHRRPGQPPATAVGPRIAPADQSGIPAHAGRFPRFHAVAAAAGHRPGRLLRPGPARRRSAAGAAGAGHRGQPGSGPGPVAGRLRGVDSGGIPHHRSGQPAGQHLLDGGRARPAEAGPSGARGELPGHAAHHGDSQRQLPGLGRVHGCRSGTGPADARASAGYRHRSAAGHDPRRDAEHVPPRRCHRPVAAGLGGDRARPSAGPGRGAPEPGRGDAAGRPGRDRRPGLRPGPGGGFHPWPDRTAPTGAHPRGRPILVPPPRRIRWCSISIGA